MPWRKNTLTTFGVPGSEAPENPDLFGSSASDRGSAFSLVSADESLGNADVFHDNDLDDLLESSLERAMGDLHCSASVSEGPCDADWELVGAGRGRSSGYGYDLGLSSVPRGPRLARDSFEQMLDTAFINTRKVQFFDMPWEKSFAKRILGKEPLIPKPLQGLSSTWVDVSSASGDANQISDSMPVYIGESDVEPFYKRALMAISDKSFHEQMEEQLNHAVDKWLSVIRMHPGESDTGRILLEDEAPETCKSGARRTIAATLGVKSKSTAVTRANAFLRFTSMYRTRR